MLHSGHLTAKLFIDNRLKVLKSTLGWGGPTQYIDYIVDVLATRLSRLLKNILVHEHPFWDIGLEGSDSRRVYV